MEALFNDIQKQIAANMGDIISRIDEDYGQLEALSGGEDQYPVTFPCILIGAPEVKWETLKAYQQKGNLTLTVRLAFDCYDDTHYGSTQEQKAADRLRTAALLNSYLHGWSFEGCGQAMVRTTSRQYSLPGGIKVYEQEYTTRVADEIRETVTAGGASHPPGG